MNKNVRNRAILYWIPVLLWAGLIFYLSGISGLRGGFSTPVEILVRKLAHASEFGILAILIFLLTFKGYGQDINKSFFLAIFSTLLYALSDELHQSFVAARDGNFKDVAVDFFGAYISLKLVYFIFKKKIKTAETLKVLLALGAFIAIVFLQMWEAIEVQKELVRMEQAKQKISQEIQQQQESEQSKQEKEPAVLIKEKTSEEVNNSENEQSTLPDKLLIDVPFSSQAPYGNWDDVHQEACEEMSLIMVKYYLDGEQLDRETAEQEIMELKEFQEKEYGHYKDSSMAELVEIAQEFYEIDNMEVIYDFDKSELKKQLAKGKPVIVPTAGRRLGNPNFTPPGPLYHNLVLIGYQGNKIITNDPGTRKGEKYEYQLETIYNAIHDYQGSKEQIELGRKAMIILK